MDVCYTPVILTQAVDSLIKKILVVGIPGAGKSTLSVQLGEILNLPVYHLDKYYWKPGWIESEEREWREKIKELVLKENWIIDGNYFGTMDIRFPHADTIIHLDFKRSVCLWRIFKRVLTGYNKVRSDAAEGCPERFDFEFIKFVIQFPKKQRPLTLAMIEKYKNEKEIIILKNSSQVKDFIKNITTNQ